MKKLKHIKYTKLSPISSETVPSPVESPFCRTSKISAASAGDLIVVMFDLDLIGSLESPPSNLLKATRKPDVLVLSEIRE
jgi:hypothetical protein